MKSFNQINEKLNQKLNGNKKWFVSVVILALLAIGVLGWQAGGIKRIVTTFLGTSDKATLAISPSSGEFEVNKEFEVKIILNTKSNNVVAVGAYLSYNPSEIEVVSIKTDNSDFSISNPCLFEGKPCEIINHNAQTGKIEIVKGKPTPGVNKSNALVATLSLKGKKELSPSTDNFVFEFSGPYQGKSRVILDDGKGTDILSGVDSGRFIFKTAVPGCNCIAWQDKGCGLGSCLDAQMQQTRSCTPSLCDIEAQCVVSSSCAGGTYNPDLNGDGTIGSTDATEYVRLWRQNDLKADVNNDGQVGSTDATEYVRLWRQSQ